MPAMVLSKRKRSKSLQRAPHATGAFCGVSVLITGASNDKCVLELPTIKATVAKVGSDISPDGATNQEHSSVVAADQDTVGHPAPRKIVLV
jgi:hypothetical protein